MEYSRVPRIRIWIWGMFAALASLLPFYFLQLDSVNHSLTYPLYDASGDTIFHWVLVKAVLGGHVIPFVKMVIPQVSAPFGPLVFSEGFPLPEQLQLFVIKLIGYGSNDPIRVHNIYYLFGYVLTSIAFFSTAIWLRIRPAVAFGLSLSFTYINYHLVRYHHVELSQYWVLAPAAGIILKVLDGSWPRSKEGNLTTFFAALFITLWHSYYGYFFCGMFITAWLIKSWRGSVTATLKVILPLVFGFLLALGFSTANYVVASHESTDLPHKIKRFPGETRHYRLRLSSVLLPTPHHRIPFFAELRRSYVQSHGETEGVDEAVGTLSVIGLAMGIFIFIRGVIRKRRDDLSHYGLAQILVLFFASSVGISMWIAIIVSPTFRSVNRISPMLAAICLLLLGILISRYLARYDGKKWGMCLTSFLGVSIGLFAVWDQVPRFRPDPQIYTDLDVTRKFTQAVEALVGGGAVLQIPNQAFPEGGNVNRMTDYAHINGPLFSKETRWSYGAFKGTHRMASIFSIGENPTDILAAKKFGYVGVWIDRWGYPDQAAAIEEALGRQLRKKPLISEDGRRSFFLYD